MKRIESERLVLRKFSADDVTEIHELFCMDETMRLVGMYPAFTDISETKRRVERWENAGRHLAITLKESGDLLGYIVISPDSEENRDDTRELGFAILPKYRRKGYMKEAIRAVLCDLERDGVRYVWTCCFKENIASENLIRSVGFEFQREGKYESDNDRVYESLEFRIDCEKFVHMNSDSLGS